LLREQDDYFRRQPRIDPTKLSYNYEQYRKYTKTLKVAKEKDDFESQRFYKMVKYIKDKEHLGERDNWVKRFKLDG